MLSFKGFLNLASLEDGLTRRFSKSFKEKQITIDLSEVEWISPLSLSVIYSCSWEIVSSGGHATIIPPTRDTFASSFLDSTSSLVHFQEQGIDIEGHLPSHRKFRSTRIASFEVFKDRSTFEKYINSLDTESRLKWLLNASELPEVISSGQFHRIALQELLDNTFRHADGTNSFYTVFEADPAKKEFREKHPIFSSLSGAGYIEVCVGDSSRNNLVDTLKDFLPDDYKTIVQNANVAKLDRQELCILYAFEYGTTSKPDERLKQITEYLGVGGNGAAVIATGLYNVLSLVKFYGGQIVIRTAGRLVTLDYSNLKSAIPRVAAWRNISRRALTRLKGTIILLRIPYQRSGMKKELRPKQPIESQRPETELDLNSLSTIVISPDITPAKQIDENQVLTSLHEKTLKALRRISMRPRIVAILLDGIRVSSKAFGTFLQLVARLPRHGSGLIVITDNSQHVVNAEQQWERIYNQELIRNDFIRQPAFLLAVDANIGCSVYGSIEHAEGTTVADDVIRFPFTGAGVSTELIERIRTNHLGEIISRPPVCHPKRLYLIEAAYYTEKFYEIRKLVDVQMNRRSLIFWFKAQLEKWRPTIIIYNPSFLKEIIEDASSFHSDLKETLELYEITDDNVFALVLDIIRSQTENKKVLIFLDVICTGRLIRKFLEVFPYPQICKIVTLVNARPEEAPYLALTKTGGSVDIPISFIVKDPLNPIYDRPENIRAGQVVVIDRRTHSPTRYPVPHDVSHEDNLLLRRVDSVGGLSTGHFVFKKDRHYLYFFSFSNTFDAIRNELINWLRAEAHELLVTVGVKAEEVETYCLDEGTGLFKIVESALRETALPSPNPITRNQLSAPPVLDSVQRDRKKTAWFIIPAMASGTTARRCLEFGNSSGMKRVHVSVIISRLEPEILLFYQNIRKYSEIDSLIHFMFSIPLPSYVEGQCPACSLNSSLQGAIVKIGQTRPQLRKMLEESIADVQPVSVHGPTGADIGKSIRGSKVDPPIWLQAHVRGQYERAIRDLEVRTSLKASLEDQATGEALATDVGRELSGSAFTSERLRDILYDPELINHVCRRWAKKDHFDPHIFILQLRGFCQITPDVIKQMLPGLFTRCIDNVSLFPCLLVEGVRQPELFWEAIEGSPSPKDLFLKDALEELKDYIRRGGGGIASTGILALHDLKWHLTRSSGWGMPLETLKMYIKNNSPREQLTSSYERFRKEGFQEAQRRLRIARNTGTIWDRLTHRQRDLEQLWLQVETSMDNLDEIIVHDSSDNKLLWESLANLDECRRKFVKGLDKIALRPGTEMNEIYSLLESSGNKPSFRVNVTSDCPSIAMTKDDFAEIILLLLENENIAAQHGMRNETSFHFEPLRPGGFGVLLCVTQTAPWLTSPELEGGLARIRELITHFGGSMQLIRPQDESQPILRIRFYAWPMQIESPPRDLEEQG